ncbi:MAG: hypothetical protein AAF675_05225 [Pseudomonadota bacterium]
MKIKMLLTATLTAIGLSAGSAAAEGITIYTGGAPTGEGSTYHMGMGQGVADMLEDFADQFGYEIKRVPSGGAVDNARRVAAHTGGIAFGIGQGGLSYEEVESGQIMMIRNDLPGECAMAFTREPRIENWASVVANAGRVTWVVPENSGSEAFIRKMYSIDPDFAGVQPRFAFTSGQDAIMAAVSNPANRGFIGFFYAYPNPASGLVNAAAEADLRVMGVLSPAVARTDDAFYLNRKAPYELSLFGLGTTKTVRAMCSKALLFANDPATITDEWARGDAEQILKAVRSAPPEAFVPQNGPLASLMLEVEGLSEEFGVNEMAEDLASQVATQIEELQQ